MTCIVEKDCKRASEVKRRGFDLTWLCARKWRAGLYVPLGTRIRPFLIDAGGEAGFTGWEYEATVAGYTGETEPAWPTGATPFTDGSVTWQRAAISAASLEKTVSGAGDVDWDGDAGMTIADPALSTTGFNIVISAEHGGGTAGTKSKTWAIVTYSDGTVDEFQIQWTIQR